MTKTEPEGMVIEDAAEAMLSDFEAYEFLKKMRPHRQNKPEFSDLNIIERDVLHYLEDKPAASQKAEHVQQFTLSMSKFDLTKAELLQLVNWRPKDLLELAMFVSDLESRFTSDQHEEMLSIITSLLPPAPSLEVRQEI
ncbi:hypothetical protein SeMB42_g04062 [Synchytrium endobioticum]|uniref:DNA-directed RNA polymerase III subunit RPC9 n=1 Tax=Synchytrium endobioticum TaxID=286115 RepID=A0A507D1G1_9FUNG|nr:hypothetical protein SeMB42_g04062 [Synchytrium endobioticum]TPX46205.1 hypothetical protein SeLEV6574_g03333 [Synchytrium endobioticum]